MSRYVKEFSTVRDIADWLRDQWAGMFKELLASKKKKIGKHKRVRINSYKLFYFRRSKNISSIELSRKSNTSVSKYRTYEKPIGKFKHGSNIFPYADEIDIEILAMNLGLHKTDLMLGNVDDYSYQFYEYYTRYKGKKIDSISRRKEFLFPARVVVFDFDGTLTKTKDNMTTWEKLWVQAGYTVNDCAKYHNDFSKGRISHKEWCNKTLEYFKNGGLKLETIDRIAKEIYLIDDVPDTLRL